MKSNSKKITIIGAGLVGSLLSIYLARRGYEVEVYERRPDMRKENITGGRSINLALSNRGWWPLKEVDLVDIISPMITPMLGRMMHDESGELTFQSYGKENQAINSISRGGLNQALITQAESEGARIFFNFSCNGVDIDASKAFLTGEGKSMEVDSDVIVGADGAYSAVRTTLQATDRFNYSLCRVVNINPAPDEAAQRRTRGKRGVWFSASGGTFYRASQPVRRHG